MLEALKFVKGAVGKKDFVPALTHFRIAAGRVTGYNGRLSLSAPIALDIDCCPRAVPFVRAIEACEETAQLHLTPAGKLAIRSGKFRAHVDTLPEDMFPDLVPEGIQVIVNGAILPALKMLHDFASDDASRPWATGVLLDGECAYATNNVVLAEAWLGCHFPYRVNVPRYTVKEMLRIGEEPLGIQLTLTSITFHYSEGRWLRSQLNSAEWPDTTKLMQRLPKYPFTNIQPVPDNLFSALETLAPFLGDMGAVFMLPGNPGRLATAPEEGASFDISAELPAGLYNHKMISLLDGVAKGIGFSEYPDPVPWYGANVRGLLMGMRLNQGEVK